MPWGVSLVFLLSFFSRWISCGCLQSFFIHCHWPRYSCLSHAKASFSLWLGFSSLHFQSFLVFTFLSFHLEDIFYHSHPQNGKALDSPASLRPISLTFCVSKLFERIILSRLLFFLKSNFILSPRQVGFRSGRSPLDQILFLSQSISDGLNKPRPGSRTILFTIDFSKAFDSVWHPALFYKLISGLPPCFARWTQSFLSDRRVCVIFQNHKSRSFRVRRVVLQGSVLGPVLFCLFINDLPASQPSSVSCSLYADDLAIWSSYPLGPQCSEGRKRELCFNWSAGPRTGVFLSIPANVKPLSFQSTPTKLTSSPISSYSTPASVSIQLQLFLGSPSTALFLFLNMYLRWRPSFSHVSRPYAVSLLPHGAPLRSPSLFCIKLFFGPFSLALHPDGFLSLASPISPNWNASTKQPAAPSPAASRPPLSHFFPSRLLYLPYESPWLISLCHLMTGLFVSQPPFLF